MTKAKKIGYIDGFVLTVPQAKLAEYKKLSRKMGKIMREYGVLDYIECVGDDMKNTMGPTFVKLTKAKRNEVVVFSWIAYGSKAQRNSINKKIMQDPRVKAMCSMQDMPFDCKRMSYGGFKTIVNNP